MNGLIQANISYLQQAADLVEAMEDGSYCRAEPMFYNSSVGEHLRHCLEHYEAFVAGAGQGSIDYDARCRDKQVENKTCAASERINSIITGLKQLETTAMDPAVRVKMDCGCDKNHDDEAASEWQLSTLGRELQFLISHTVHHFAMIRGICQRAGNELDENFGVAPSTISHRQQLCEQTQH